MRKNEHDGSNVAPTQRPAAVPGALTEQHPAAYCTTAMTCHHRLPLPLPDLATSNACAHCQLDHGSHGASGTNRGKVPQQAEHQGKAASNSNPSQHPNQKELPQLRHLHSPQQQLHVCNQRQATDCQMCCLMLCPASSDQSTTPARNGPCMTHPVGPQAGRLTNDDDTEQQDHSVVFVSQVPTLEPEDSDSNSKGHEAQDNRAKMASHFRQAKHDVMTKEAQQPPEGGGQPGACRQKPCSHTCHRGGALQLLD
jgi:hypothetical protein